MRSKILSKQSSFLLTLKCVGIEEGYIAFYSISVCNDDVIFETEVWENPKFVDSMISILIWFIYNKCILYK